jgi:hypothetical protein
LDDSGLGVFDLSDPVAPSEIDTLTFGANQVREQTHNADLTRFVVAGKDSVRTVSFDGAALAIEDELIAANMPPQQNRGVTMAGASDEQAVIAFFRGGNGDDILNGGVALYAIDSSTGALSELDFEELDGPGRVALRVLAD